MHIDQSTFMHAYSAAGQIRANKKRNTELYMKMRQKHTHLGTGLAVRITSTGVLGYKIVFSQAATACTGCWLGEQRKEAVQGGKVVWWLKARPPLKQRRLTRRVGLPARRLACFSSAPLPPPASVAVLLPWVVWMKSRQLMPFVHCFYTPELPIATPWRFPANNGCCKRAFRWWKSLGFGTVAHFVVTW